MIWIKKIKLFCQQERNAIFFTVVWMDDLEIFHRGLRYASVEVQHIGLSLLIPAWGFVYQSDQLVGVSIGMADQ